MKPIAHMHTDMPQKFGIPRNGFVAPHLQGSIVFEPEFAVASAVDGLEEFTHLWVIWQFENGEPGGTAKEVPGDARGLAAGRGPATSALDGLGNRENESARAGAVGAAAAGGVANVDGTVAAGGVAHASGAAGVAAASRAAKWSPTVRPPRLGGSKRKGVFATRSPFRPNPIGLTCVTLDRIEFTEAGPVIHVLGADLRDGTPILDIKPYIPYADCRPEATGGWIERAPWKELEVVFPEHLQQRIESSKRAGLVEVLRQDPRRAGSKHDPERVYRMAYAGRDVAFCVDGKKLTVVEVY